MKLLTVFLDSSVVLSGLASTDGGSGKILYAGGKNKLKLVATKLVIKEVIGHLDKLGIAPDKLTKLLDGNTINVINSPIPEAINKFTKAASDINDAHILAGAVLAKADILISLDKKHILSRNAVKILKPIQVLSPKQFWKRIMKPL